MQTKGITAIKQAGLKWQLGFESKQAIKMIKDDKTLQQDKMKSKKSLTCKSR